MVIEKFSLFPIFPVKICMLSENYASQHGESTKVQRTCIMFSKLHLLVYGCGKMKNCVFLLVYKGGERCKSL